MFIVDFIQMTIIFLTSYYSLLSMCFPSKILVLLIQKTVLMTPTQSCADGGHNYRHRCHHSYPDPPVSVCAQRRRGADTWRQYLRAAPSLQILISHLKTVGFWVGCYFILLILHQRRVWEMYVLCFIKAARIGSVGMRRGQCVRPKADFWWFRPAFHLWKEEDLFNTADSLRVESYC